MDKHLNTFYPYSLRDKDSFKEDNITRASLITFDSLKNQQKVNFINNLIGKKILSLFKKYLFCVELQSTDISNDLTNELSIDYDSLPKANRYMVGFCPNGKVGDSSKKEEIVDLVYNSPINHNARADGQIKVLDKHKKVILVVLFENKLFPLYPDQLHRHFSLLLGLNSKEEFFDSLRVYSYRHFFSLFCQKKNKYVIDLLDYMNISGYIYPETFKDLEKIRFNFRDNVEHLLFNVLKKLVSNESLIERQKGWGYTIHIKGNKYIEMIGLVFKEEQNEIELSLKFASKMSIAKRFYKSIIEPKMDAINFEKFKGELHLGHNMGYVQKSYLCFSDAKKYVTHLLDNDKVCNLKQGSLSNALQFVNELIDNAFPSCDKKEYEKIIKSDNRLVGKDVWIAPSFTYCKQWAVKDLYRTTIDDFADEILENIRYCENMLGIKIAI